MRIDRQRPQEVKWFDARGALFVCAMLAVLVISYGPLVLMWISPLH